MDALMKYHYEVDGNDFTRAGETSSSVKKILRSMGFSPETIRRVAIAMYEGEINMVIHANGGTIDAYIDPDKITVVMKDTGPGIKDISLAMQEGYSTATNKIRELGFGAGMGIPNMKKYSDEMDIDTEVGVGTTLTLTFYPNEN